MNCWDAKPDMGMPISSQADLTEGQVEQIGRFTDYLVSPLQDNKPGTSVGQPDFPVDDIVGSVAKAIESGIKSLDPHETIHESNKNGMPPPASFFTSMSFSQLPRGFGEQ